MTILETFIKLRDDLKTWVTNNLNQKANISYVDEKFEEVAVPSVTEEDNGKILRVVNGSWDATVDDTSAHMQYYILNIDYDATLAFDTSEVIFGANTSSVLGQAILGQMVLA
jgi:hypothetical protein